MTPVPRDECVEWLCHRLTIPRDEARRLMENLVVADNAAWVYAAVEQEREIEVEDREAAA